MTKLRFWAVLGGFRTFLGLLGPRTGHSPPNQEIGQIVSPGEILPKFFFRPLNNPKRVGLGQKVPEKYPFGPNEVQFMVPKPTYYLF